MSLPSGASTSIGVMSITISPYLIRSPSRAGALNDFSGMVSLTALTSTSKFRLSSDENSIGCLPVINSILLKKSWVGASISDLLWIIMNGISFSLNLEIRSVSELSHSLPAITISARSIMSRVRKVRSTLFIPRSPVSSMPAVSTSITGPKPVISKDFLTGSVVVPA